MPNVVLITGVSRFLGGRLAALLAADPDVDRVIGVDTVPPAAGELPGLGRTEFVRADIRNPLVGKVVAQAGVTTVVHAALTTSARLVGGRVAMQETNVLGTMQLLAACRRADSLTRVVLCSTGGVYGSGPGLPAVLVEDAEPRGAAPRGVVKDAAEAEAHVRGFARRRPDVRVTVLRLGEVLGPSRRSRLARYLAGPVVPTPLGHDPRLHLVHEDDAVEVLRLAACTDRRAVTANVAADGVLPLSQLLRRAGRVGVPVPAPVLPRLSALIGNTGLAELAAAEPEYLRHGRVLDTRVLRDEFGYTPRWSASATVESWRRSAGSPVPQLASAAAVLRSV